MIVNLQSQYLIAFFLLINLLNKCLDLKQNIAHSMQYETKNALTRTQRKRILFV